MSPNLPVCDLLKKFCLIVGPHFQKVGHYIVRVGLYSFFPDTLIENEV